MVSIYQKIRLVSKKLYWTFGHVICPALDGETIIFNSVGFNHLIRKGKKMRPISDQIRRFKILPSAVNVLQKGKLSDYRIIKNTQYVQFWTISYDIEGKKLNVVVIQKGNGKKIFLSITEKN